MQADATLIDKAIGFSSGPNQSLATQTALTMPIPRFNRMCSLIIHPT